MISASDIKLMTPAEAWEALAQLASIQPLLIAKAQEPVSRDDGDVNVGEAARLTGMSRFYFYDHWRELPFARKVGKRSIRLQRKGLMEWRATRNGN